MDILKVDPFDNVVATGRATTKYRPVGPSSLFGLVLKLSGTDFDKSHITAIRVKAPGGKDLFNEISCSRMVDINSYDSVIEDATFIPIYFGDPTARTIRGMYLGSFDHTAYPGDLTIEVQISGATAPELEARALVKPPKIAMGLDYNEAEQTMHRALIETVITLSAGVTRKAESISLPPGAQLKKLVFFHSNITELDAKKEGFQVYEDVENALASYLQGDLFTRVPQSGLLVYDRLISNDYSDAGRTVRQNGSPANWQFRLTTSAADTITVYSDVLAPLSIL